MSKMIVSTKNGLWLARAAGDGWRATASGLQGHEVTCVAARQGRVVAGTTDGLFRSEDGGRSWQASDAGLAVRHVRWLSFHPEQPDRLFAGTEPAAIFLSEDGGQSWRACPGVAALRDEHGWYLPYSDEAACVRSFTFHGVRGYAAVEVGGLLRSDDCGAQWRLAEGSDGRPHTEVPWQGPTLHPDVHSVEIHPAAPELLFAATNGGLFRSEDGGAIWERIAGDCYCRAFWLDPADPDHIVLGHATRRGWQGSIQETRDGGRRWQATTDHLGAPWTEGIVERIEEVGGALIAVRDNGTLLQSPCDRLDWQPILAELPAITGVAAL